MLNVSRQALSFAMVVVAAQVLSGCSQSTTDLASVSATQVTASAKMDA
jgi:hypothetical protein